MALPCPGIKESISLKIGVRSQQNSKTFWRSPRDILLVILPNWAKTATISPQSWLWPRSPLRCFSLWKTPKVPKIITRGVSPVSQDQVLAEPKFQEASLLVSLRGGSISKCKTTQANWSQVNQIDSPQAKPSQSAPVKSIYCTLFTALPTPYYS